MLHRHAALSAQLGGAPGRPIQKHHTLRPRAPTLFVGAPARHLMNSSRSARQMGSEDSPITPRYSVMNASEPSRFWMPPESRVSPEYTAPAHADGAGAHPRDPLVQSHA